MALIRLFIDASGRTRSALAIVVLAVLAGLASGAGNTWILAAVHQSIAGGVPRGTGPILAFIVVCAATVVARAVSQILLTRFAIAVAQDLRLRLCHRIVASNLRRLEETGQSRLLGAFTEDTPAITNGLAQVPALCVNGVIVVGGLAYIGWLSPAVLLLLLGAGGAAVVVYRRMQRTARARFSVAHGTYMALLKHFRALVHGSKELQLHAERRSEFMRSEIATTTAGVARHRFQASMWFIVAENWVVGVVWLLMGLLLLAPVLVDGVDHGGATGSVLVFLYLTQPVQAVLGVVAQLTQADFAVGKVRAVEEALTKGLSPVAQRDSAPVRLPWRELELRGVTHTYARDGQSNFTLGPIDLTLRGGETVFIVGGNGSGKTTLMKLLTGLYIPERGEIRLDGAAITPDLHDWYRGRFSAVFADFHLFDRLWGLPEVDAAARHYLSVLQLDGKVQVKEGTLSTTELSQGQRKRLALLTAYLENRDIYVFDEWAADQDPVFRNFFYRELLPELKARGKTLLVVSHDDRYYGLADRIVKLEYGVVEQARDTVASEHTMAIG